MQKIKYQTSIMENGQILLPKNIIDRYLLKPNQKINLTIEVYNQEKKQISEYSFHKVRKLLQGIKGNVSDDIIADRDDRI